MLSTLLGVISANKGLIIKRAIIGAAALAGGTIVTKFIGGGANPADDDWIDGDDTADAETMEPTDA